MTAISVPDSQQCRSAARVGFFDMHTLRAGNAISLQCRRKRMELRLLDSSGQAWITQSPPDSSRNGQNESEDVILSAGQSLRIERGSRLVMEPVGGQPVRYQWVRADDRTW